jgi:hypothetical protein
MQDRRTGTAQEDAISERARTARGRGRRSHPGVLSGLIAGAAYLMAQMSFAATVRNGQGWEPLQRIAAILPGPDAAPPPSGVAHDDYSCTADPLSSGHGVRPDCGSRSERTHSLHAALLGVAVGAGDLWPQFLAYSSAYIPVVRAVTGSDYRIRSLSVWRNRGSVVRFPPAAAEKHVRDLASKRLVRAVGQSRKTVTAMLLSRYNRHGMAWEPPARPHSFKSCSGSGSTANSKKRSPGQGAQRFHHSRTISFIIFGQMKHVAGDFPHCPDRQRKAAVCRHAAGQPLQRDDGIRRTLEPHWHHFKPSGFAMRCGRRRTSQDSFTKFFRNASTQACSGSKSPSAGHCAGAAADFKNARFVREISETYARKPWPAVEDHQSEEGNRPASQVVGPSPGWAGWAGLARYSVRVGKANWMPRAANSRSSPKLRCCCASMYTL